VTDWSRLTQYIIDYFPEPKYSPKDIKDWGKENVPAWDKISSSEKKEIIQDWEDTIAEPIEREARSWSKRIVDRIKGFLGRLF